jgi:site-specific recombinase XerD
MATVGGDPADATTAHVHAFAYGDGPHGREPSPSTVIVRLAALRSFYDFARRMGLVATNPTVDVKRPKARPPVPRGLEVDELQRLLGVIPDTVVGKRDRAIVLVAVFTGLRRQEIIGLRAGDLTRNGAVYYNVRVKGGTTRRRELPQPAFNAILDALVADGRPLEGLGPEDSLFNISDVTFYAYLRKYAKRAGLDGLKPHDLRHTAAKLRRNNGASIEDVGALLGHASIATTARYLARMEGEADNGWDGVAVALGVE